MSSRYGLFDRIALLLSEGRPAYHHARFPYAHGFTRRRMQFFGTLTNTTNADLFLNADNFNLAELDPSTIDDSPFFANAPIFLGPGSSTGDIGLFNIAIPDPFATGNFGGTFELLGGVDGDAQDIIGSADFTVQVQQSTTVPEPSSAVLLSGSLFLLLVAKQIIVIAKKRSSVAPIAGKGR